MELVLIALLMMGLIFYAGGTVGILRFPDFYTRLHAAGKLDTFGLVTTTGALAAYEAWTEASYFVAAKIVLIAVFVFITSPTATHAIVDAGVNAGLTPWQKPQPAGTDSDDLGA